MGNLSRIQPLGDLEPEATAQYQRHGLARHETGRHLPRAHLVEGPEPRFAGQGEVKVEKGSLLASLAGSRWPLGVADHEVAAGPECACGLGHELTVRRL